MNHRQITAKRGKNKGWSEFRSRLARVPFVYGLTFSFFMFFLLLSAMAVAQEGSLWVSSPVMSQAQGGNVVGHLPMGASVRIRSRVTGWVEVESRGLRGWVRDAIITLPQGWQSIHTKTLHLLPKIILDAVPTAVWIYDNQMWYYDINARRVLKRERFQKSLSGMIGFHRNRWLLFHKTWKESESATSQILDIWLRDMATKRQFRLGLFDDRRLSLDDFVISPDNRYALVRMMGARESVTHIYDLQHFRWMGWVTNVAEPRWLNGNEIMFQRRDRIFVSSVDSWIQAAGVVEGTPVPLPRTSAQLSSYRLEADRIFVLMGRRVYSSDRAGTNWQLTPLRSLDWNADKTINVSIDSDGNGAEIYNVPRGRALRGFSGENPTREFVGFTLEGLLIRQNFARIPTLFLVDNDLREIHRYKAIDYIHAADGLGTLMEVIEEDGEILIIVESPARGYYFVFPRRL